MSPSGAVTFGRWAGGTKGLDVGFRLSGFRVWGSGFYPAELPSGFDKAGSDLQAPWLGAGGWGFACFVSM